jgi:hypothetical protein
MSVYALPAVFSVLSRILLVTVAFFPPLLSLAAVPSSILPLPHFKRGPHLSAAESCAAASLFVTALAAGFPTEPVQTCGL